MDGRPNWKIKLRTLFKVLRFSVDEVLVLLARLKESKSFQHFT